MDYSGNIDNITFTSGMGVNGISCVNVDILVDSESEDEELFQIILQDNVLVQTVPPNVSTVFIGKLSMPLNQISMIMYLH